jgi:hypothetical protein
MLSSHALSASVGSLSELVEIDSDDGESLCDDVTDDVVMTLPSEASSTAAVAASAGAGTGAGAVSTGVTGITAAVDADVACATAVAGLIGESVYTVMYSALLAWGCMCAGYFLNLRVLSPLHVAAVNNAIARQYRA